MAWLERLFRRSGESTWIGPRFGPPSSSIARDGKRAAEVREFSNGQTYLLESEWVSGTTYEERHGGRMRLRPVLGVSGSCRAIHRDYILVYGPVGLMSAPHLLRPV